MVVKAEWVEMLHYTNDVSFIQSLLDETAYVAFTKWASIIPAERADKQVTWSPGLLNYLIVIDPPNHLPGFSFLGAQNSNSET